MIPYRRMPFWIIAIVLTVGGGVWGESVVTLDGRAIAGQAVTLTAEGAVVHQGDRSRTIPLSDVWQVLLATGDDAMDLSGQIVVRTRYGGRLPCTSLRLDDGTFRLNQKKLGRLSAPIDAVGGVILPPPEQTPQAVLDACHRRGLTGGARDVLVVASGGERWQSVDGLLVAVGSEKVTFRYRREDRTIDRTKVRAVWLAEPVDPPAAPPARLTLRDGTVLAGRAITLNETQAKIDSPVWGSLTVERSAVAEIRMMSDRAVSLTERKRVSKRVQGFFGEGDRVAVRVGRCSGGGALRVGGREYTDGLGLSSFCELTYDVGGEYRYFVATVAIDDSVRPHGRAGVTILTDGQPVGEPIEVTGTDPPRTVRREIAGAKTLTIRVDFGEDGLPVGDSVDLIRPRLVKH